MPIVAVHPGAAAHMLSSFVARQRHTVLQLAVGVWHEEMKALRVTGFQDAFGR